MMVKKKPIHTTLHQKDIQELMEYGDGKLNVGIENVLRIAKQKSITIKIPVHIDGW